MILIDPEDQWILDVLPWRITPKGYAEATQYDGVWRKTVKLHHFIMGTPIWEGESVDHVNRNKLDNRRANLRWVDRFVSSQNRTYVDDAKNIRVVKDGKFEVRVQRDGTLHQVGTFATLEEAQKAREEFFVNQVHVPNSDR